MGQLVPLPPVRRGGRGDASGSTRRRRGMGLYTRHVSRSWAKSQSHAVGPQLESRRLVSTLGPFTCEKPGYHLNQDFTCDLFHAILVYVPCLLQAAARAAVGADVISWFFRI
jgi:hypothetical protein